MIKIITHSSRFHADDVFAVTTLLRVLADRAKVGEEDIEIIRTRDPKLIEGGDYVVDVGGEHDEARNRFDHHQEGGGGKRENSIPYAAFGLVWKAFGKELAGSKEAAAHIDQKVVQPIDALDNGVEISRPLFEDVFPYSFPTIVGAFRSSWKEPERSLDKAFLQVVDIAGAILDREIIQARDYTEVRDIVEHIYNTTEDKRVIELDTNYPYQRVLQQYAEPLYVVRPSPQDGTWKVETVRTQGDAFANRKDLPESWAGKRDEELQNITGVSDAVFCHNARFLAVAESREGAWELTRLALEN